MNVTVYLDDVIVKHVKTIGTVRITMLKGEKGDTGYPTDAQVIAAVTEVLEDHPEWTTTVEDGAITTAKLANGAVTAAKLGSDVFTITGTKLVLGG